ncbi:two-component system sensor histidine kinase QseC [Neisseria perflava]|uniref:ATP-binding protein n=1 Tax=Neisseria perflava TaxID=33053 RepID=UPI00209E473F|nr:ATP-binding protein [Neisseria perflava]MCP1772756.1 two-component system sensor histidine kinase QseC [Neisseria perflava]
MYHLNLPPETSIKKRLTVYLILCVLFVWIPASLVAFGIELHELNEAADTQMTQLSRSVPKVNAAQTLLLPTIEDALGEDNIGEAENKNNGLAVWDITGKLLLADEYGKNIPFQTTPGFVNSGSPWQSDSWRILYLHLPETGQTVAVSQRWRERLAVLTGSLMTELISYFLTLPLMAWVGYLAINRSLRPLNRMAAELGSRRADNLTPVSAAVPQEIQPVVHSLNRLFERVSAAIAREQRFTADAAHELRSPLAALKVQTDVLAMSEPDEQPHHLAQIYQSLDRAEHLINQLLALARLDPAQSLQRRAAIDWAGLSGQVLQHVNLAAREKHIRLKREIADHPLPLSGDPALLQLMLRNLLDNAVRYSPEHSKVSLHIYADKIEVRDHGAGIAAEHLPRIKERFYRPAGQNAQGSGLGLSIVEQIAKLHGLAFHLENRAEGGLSAWLVAEEKNG